MENCIEFGYIEDARAAAAIWQRLDPENPLPYARHSVAEWKAQNYPEAVRLWWQSVRREKKVPAPAKKR